jgi:YVTN family beta-propeller protein
MSHGTPGMDETTLRRLLDSALVHEPPMGPVAQNALRAGIKLRRRRRIVGAARGVAVAAAIAVAIPAVTRQLVTPPAGREHTQFTTYVTNSLSNTVTPIAAVSNTPGKPIKVGKRPSAIAITPDGKTAYVANFGSDTVTPIVTATNVTGKPIRVGHGPSAMAITPDGKTVYVVNLGSTTVTPISTATNTPGRPIAVGLRPRLIEITPDGKTAYVSGDSNTVTPIVTATNKARKPIRVGHRPSAIVITPDGKTAYVAARGTVTPIMTTTNKPGRPIKVGGGPVAIAITPNGRTIYAVQTSGSANVWAIATATNTSHLVNVLVYRPLTATIFITPDGKTVDIYYANMHSIAVFPIVTANDNVKRVRFIKVSTGPSPPSLAIAITADSKTVYIANSGANVVVPIATSTNMPGRPIKVGNGPSAVAIMP